MGRAQRHPWHRRRAVPDAEGSRPALSSDPRESPNIWRTPATYEIENLAFDREGVADAALRELAPLVGRDVLDIGCGTGFHLAQFAEQARSVVGVEPHPALAAIARRRSRELANVEVLDGRAEGLPLADQSVDVALARWAYFFGPGCEPGLAELDRVIRPGGIAVLLDNDATRSTFGRWFRAGFPNVDPDAVAAFWIAHGWTTQSLLTAWTFDTREDLEAVVRIELPSGAAEAALDEQESLAVDYAVNLYWKRY